MPRSLLTLAVLGLLASPDVAEAESLDQFGRHHDLTTSPAAYTVLDFAAAWCRPCYQALPELQTLAGEHPAGRFLVISVDDEPRGRDRLIDELALHLPVIWDDGHHIVERFAPRGFPATYVLDSQGEIVYQHVGYSKKKWRQLVVLLSQLDTSTAAPHPAPKPASP